MSTPLAIENPGPPGFSRFWGRRFTPFGLLDASVPKGSNGATAKNFLARKFLRQPTFESGSENFLARKFLSKEGADMPPPE
jgi:hypothetical protein